MDAAIRRARRDDAGQIGRFQTRAWDQAYRGSVPDGYLDATTWRMRAARWRDRVVSDEREVFVAEVDGTLVGVASTAVTPVDRPDLPGRELSSLYVDQAVYGSGIAALLLDAAIGDRPAHLWVFEANDRAQRFYEKHGFAATAERRSDPDTGMPEVRWVRRSAAA